MKILRISRAERASNVEVFRNRTNHKKYFGCVMRDQKCSLSQYILDGRKTTRNAKWWRARNILVLKLKAMVLIQHRRIVQRGGQQSPLIQDGFRPSIEDGPWRKENQFRSFPCLNSSFSFLKIFFVARDSSDRTTCPAQNSLRDLLYLVMYIYFVLSVCDSASAFTG